MTSRYHIIARVAQGGFSTIDHATDTELGNDVALKRPISGQPASAQHLLNETAILRSFQHEHVIGLLDHGTDRQGLFLALPWIEGHTLDRLINKQAWTPSQIVTVLWPLLQAVTALHAIGFAHGDLNASNLLIDGSGHVTLIDFGNAWPLADTVIRPITDANIGSIHHMAPELFDGQRPYIRSDLYAIGVIAYNALTQRFPFEGDTKAQVITAHHRHLCKPLPPSPLSPWVMTLLARDPSARPASVEEALQTLPSPVTNIQAGR